MSKGFARKLMEKIRIFGSGISKEKLQKKYNQQIQESFDLPTVNLKKSDLKRAEAEEIGKQMYELEENS